MFTCSRVRHLVHLSGSSVHPRRPPGRWSPGRRWYDVSDYRIPRTPPRRTRACPSGKDRISSRAYKYDTRYYTYWPGPTPRRAAPPWRRTRARAPARELARASLRNRVEAHPTRVHPRHVSARWSPGRRWYDVSDTKFPGTPPRRTRACPSGKDRISPREHVLTCSPNTRTREHVSTCLPNTRIRVHVSAKHPNS
jgi:hypothetical protein